MCVLFPLKQWEKNNFLLQNRDLFQEEDGYDFDTDVEVEGETEMETVREKVVVQFTPPQVKGPTYFHEAFLQEALLGKR